MPATPTTTPKTRRCFATQRAQPPAKLASTLTRPPVRLVFEIARTCLLAGVSMLIGCHHPPPEPEQPTPIAAPAEISSAACPQYTGAERDLSVQGSPRPSDPRCCESNFGFDPALVASSCGFVAYRGESEELACVHRFEDAGGQLHEFRLTPILDLEFEAAIALHERGEFPPTHQAGPAPDQGPLWISTTQTRHWALIPGWSATRRLSWDPAACDSANLLPVLTAMAAAPPTPPH